MGRLVVAVVCLGVLGLLLWSRPGRRADRGPARGEETPPPRNAPAAVAKTAPPPAPAPAAAPGPPEARPAEAANAREGLVAVRVVDADGTPAAGATVRVLRADPRRWAEHAPVAETVALRDGRANAPAALDGSWLVHAALDGREGWAQARADGREREVRLEEPLGAEGRVLDPDGRPVAGAEVMVSFAGPITGAASAEAAFVGITGERGTVALPLRPIHATPYLRVVARGYAIHWSELDGPALGRHGFEVRLEPVRVVRGRLVDSEGRPVGDVSVLVRETLLQGRSAPDGTFELAALPGDGGTLIVEPHRYGRIVRPLPAHDGTVDVGDLVLGPGSSIRGRVVDAGGAPVADALVQAVCIRTQLSVHGAQTGADGLFELPFLDDGSYRLSASRRPPAPGKTAATAELPSVRAGAGEVELRVEVRPLLQVDLVSKATGAPVWVLRMDVLVDRPGGETTLAEVSSPRMRRSCSTWIPLPAAGTYEVRVNADAYPEQTATVTVGQDEHRVLRVELPAADGREGR